MLFEVLKHDVFGYCAIGGREMPSWCLFQVSCFKMCKRRREDSAAPLRPDLIAEGLAPLVVARLVAFLHLDAGR